MSENHASDVRLDENPDGSVSFATDVVATIAGLAATEVEGVASMTSTSSGFADVFRKSSRNFTKGVRVDIDGNMVAVDVSIVVEYGSPVPDVAKSIQENVKKAIETMSGLDVRNVDVHVQGVSFERENRAAAELQEQQKKLLEQAAEEKKKKDKEFAEKNAANVLTEAEPDPDEPAEVVLEGEVAVEEGEPEIFE